MERYEKYKDSGVEWIGKIPEHWSVCKFIFISCPNHAFREPEFEKFYAYAKLLQTKLPKRNLSEQMQLVDEVAMEYYRLQKIKDGSIDLTTGEEGELDGLSEAGIKRAKEEKIALSEIIDVLNERFGTEFEEADRLFFEQIEAELLNNETLQS